MDKKSCDVWLYIAVFLTALFLIYGLFAGQYLLLILGILGLVIIPKIKMHSDKINGQSNSFNKYFRRIFTPPFLSWRHQTYSLLLLNHYCIFSLYRYFFCESVF